MQVRPKKRSCPSLSCSNFRKVLRQPPGDRKGNSPSSTSMRASADQKTALSKGRYRREPAAGAGVGAEPESPPRYVRKNSLPAGSITTTSLFLLKLDLYASRLR